MIARLAAALLAAAGLAACAADNTHPIAGTTTRVEEPVSTAREVRDREVHIFAGEEDCYSALTDPLEQQACLPYVDRATGQVRISFDVRASGLNVPVPLSREQIQVFHKNREVQVEAGGEFNRIELIPHGRRRTPQMFVLVIDTSGSMDIIDDTTGLSRMDKVRAALLRPDVINAFFPENAADEAERVATAVVPLTFSGSGLPQPLGGKLYVRSPEEYRTLIDKELRTGAGYTYLYQAIAYASTSLLTDPQLEKLITVDKMQPTIIALTDGFNNETAGDLCGANAARLTDLLQRLATARREATAEAQPTVYTVGLGRPAWKSRRRAAGAELEDPRVTPAQMCGPWADKLINGGVENNGVDNFALAAIAEFGGGKNYISTNSKGLAAAFKAAAAWRYQWFELRYQVDPFFLRRKFETRIKLVSLFGIGASIKIHPSGWLDAPPGIVGTDSWARPAPFRHSVRLLLPWLAGLIALSYLPAALYNARRPFRGKVGRPR